MSRTFKSALVIMAVPLVLALSLGAGPAGTSGVEKDAAEIAKKIYPSVVRVEVQNHTRRVATGVVIDKDGYVVTTALISPRREKVTITTSEGKTSEAEFLGFDNETQLAVLKVKEKGLPALSLGKSADLTPGSWICVVGITPERTPSVSQGIVSSLGEDKLRLNVWVTPGSSGGPVVDEKGQMVGLLRGIYTEERPVVFQFRDKEQSGSGYVFNRAEAPSSGMALAVPVDVVRNISVQLREKGKVERGWLGVGIGLNEDGRVEISQVDGESPAELAKLKEGDIILRIDDRDIASPDVLAAEIRKRKPGQDVVLRVERDGKPMEVKVKLGEYSMDEALLEQEARFPRLFPRPPAPARPAKPEVPGAPERVLPAPRARSFEWSYEKRKYIGVYCNELTRELSEHFGVKDGLGLIVSKLTEKAPAEKAGLAVGDVIVRLEGKRVESVNDLIDLIQDRKKGDKVKVEFLRDGKVMTREVEVAEEERGGDFDSDEFRSYLDSWQSYTDAFQNEIRKWQDVNVPEIRANMKKINEDLAAKGKESAKEIKSLVRSLAKMRKV